MYARYQSACRLTFIPQYTLRDHPITYRIAYSDEYGRDNHNSYACYREADESATGGYLCPITTVADSKSSRRGVLEACAHAIGRGHAPDPHRQHGGQSDSHRPLIRRSRTVTDRTRHQISATHTRSPFTRHGDQLGKSTHRDLSSSLPHMHMYIEHSGEGRLNQLPHQIKEHAHAYAV